jgi:hypothetical protein
MSTNVIEFAKERDNIIKAITDRSEQLGINESVTLLEGFVSQPYSTSLSSTLVIGGPSVPMVMLVGNQTGRVYLFAYKALVQENRI